MAPVVFFVLLLLNLLATAALVGWLDPVTRGAIARAITWVLIVALGFTALTGVKYGKKVQGAVEVFEKLAAEDEQDD